ncbi:hypothetical protein [Providencia sp. PROV202]|uniref:hypothetical protein n=1 Tax=Providencia sp. PROV202 TaxID=2949902 RepID=UPI00234924C8|nr:hypothetical protein [Providencia sp. PROV202]
MNQDMPPLEKRKMLFELTITLLAAEIYDKDYTAEGRLKKDFDSVYKLLNEKWESPLVKNTK